MYALAVQRLRAIALLVVAVTSLAMYVGAYASLRATDAIRLQRACFGPDYALANHRWALAVFRPCIAIELRVIRLVT